jgi:predicted lipoprotein with Yx(FWY)xxD motif
MKHKNPFPAVPALALLCGSLFSCTKDTAPTGNNPVPVLNVQVASDAGLGSILTDSAGRTLYFFSLDADGQSACTGDCLAAWPVFYTSRVNAGAGLDSTDFGSITRPDGAKQTTYKGWPLYYFASDSKAGDIKGEAINNIWFVAKPDYTVMLANGQLVGNDGVSYDSTYQPGTGKVQYLTDDRGVTLYIFSPDHLNTNTYTLPDFSNDAVWPIYQAGTPVVAPSILDKGQFGSIDVFGKTQLLFRGWPLYHFGADGGLRGSTKGVSVPTPGIWPVINQYSPEATP